MVQACYPSSIHLRPMEKLWLTNVFPARAVVVVQAIEWQRRVPLIGGRFHWAPGFFLSLSISGASLIRSLVEVQCLLTIQKIGLAAQLEAKPA